MSFRLFNQQVKRFGLRAQPSVARIGTE
ncbi:hypothetical protein GGQ85_004430 [Nitrobacter vulgaris]|nr:hypothetical protein [Nitrobacter vulgaris]